tara:strand:- start:352 stop:1056 length:705 start_codon:yes stop_codon:yes gene_type:complete
MKKTSIVIGGTKGIGSVIAKYLKLRGDITYTVSRNNSNKNYNLRCDIQKDIDLENLKKKFKRKKIDNLIFSQRYRGNDLEQDFNLLLRSTNKIIKIFSKNLSNNSSIVVLSSIATTTVLHDQNEIYHYTRGALEGLVKFYACKLGSKGTRINCIQPSKLIKPENKKFFLKKNNKDRKILEKITPLGRIGKSEDIAELALFLTSNSSSFITGTIIPVDGGLRLLSQENVYNLVNS